MIVSVPQVIRFSVGRDNTLIGAEKSRVGKPHPSVDLCRRDFLVRFCQGAGATLIPTNLWGIVFPEFSLSPAERPTGEGGFQLHPQYRSNRPIDAILGQVETGHDDFITEKYSEQIATIFATWTASLLESTRGVDAFAKVLTADFAGTSLRPIESKIVRSDHVLEVRRQRFSPQAGLASEVFVRELSSWLSSFSKILNAEFQITSIVAIPDANAESAQPRSVQTMVRYEIVGTGADIHREQRIGNWDLEWRGTGAGEFHLRRWQALDETLARARAPVYADVTTGALGGNPSYSAQLLHGTDYWRTVLDGACGIDVYGHNGISVADIDNDGFDDLYICQPAGLPNRLYRNRGDGTFEDITEASGLGVLENAACALFADFSNRGRQDVIVVCAGGPLLFLNDGSGKFRQRPDAFHFANAPQGTFTGAAVADYDRDGWLDIYFCLYSYYQGTGQYKYPSPYHDAENGPPNFLMRNQRDGTFRDVTSESGLNQNNTRYSFCCSWSDYNRDGWPDLCVVNDFGRKNLYRNKGDGTFTDVAVQAGVEDVGAGMSACWLDYDNDSADDLYIANMWTSAGERISTQDIFKKDSSKDVRALYQKHAMGNSLFRNRGTLFEDVTRLSGSGVGRWAWSSDALDFDHDGFADLYVTNGMVSGPSKSDLNSFFWRQVVARSPDDARASKDYEQGWNAINELIRSDGTWSGRERNIFYANNRDGTFSDVSGAIGLDFPEDGRAFSLADLDHDGRLELFLKNRNAPQLRIEKNVIQDLPPSISFRLQGTKSNRDAIGAAVTIKTEIRSQTRTLQAGSGFLSQHSKDLFFGLGEMKGLIRATIRWPSGLVQELHNLPANHRISVQEGLESFRAEPFFSVEAPSTARESTSRAECEASPESVETWLLAPISAPEFSLIDMSAKTYTLSAFRGKPVLMNLSTIQADSSRKDLQALQKIHERWKAQGVQLLALNIDAAGPQNDRAQVGAVRAFVREHQVSFPTLLASEDVIAIYNLLYRQIFDRHRDLILPTSFLIDSEGKVVKVYQGPIDTQRVEQDFQRIPTSDAERLARALPFPSTKFTLEFARNYLSMGALFFQRGYLDQAEVAFQQASRDDPSSAEALYGVGSVYLNQNKNAAARETFEDVVKLTANYPDTLADAWNNLGVIATREGRVADSVACFQQALQLNPHHLLSLDNLGNAYRLRKQWDDARGVLERALEVAPQDPEANYSLAMVFAQIDETDKAYQYLQRALQARPGYPEALNNLGVLYLRTDRRDQAVANFEECIRVAPTFDQAYLNLARVYAVEGSPDKAREVLAELLKQYPDHSQAKQMLEQLQK
jgi:tetratricopeptide (TPR) repeat protein